MSIKEDFLCMMNLCIDILTSIALFYVRYNQRTKPEVNGVWDWPLCTGNLLKLLIYPMMKKNKKQIISTLMVKLGKLRFTVLVLWYWMNLCIFGVIKKLNCRSLQTCRMFFSSSYQKQAETTLFCHKAVFTNILSAINTKTKLITLVQFIYKGHRQSSEPIRDWS